MEPILEDLRQRGATKIEPIVVAEEFIEFNPAEELEI